MSADYDQLMQDLCGSLGVDAQQADSGAGTTLVFDEDIVINFQFDEPTESLLLFSPLGELPEEGRLEHMLALLEGNHLWQQTGGATLGFDSATNLITMFTRLPLRDLTLEILQYSIEAYLPVAEYWQTQLTGAPPAEEEQAAGEIPLSNQNFMRP